MMLQIGEHLGPYEIITQLGAGGMAGLRTAILLAVLLRFGPVAVMAMCLFNDRLEWGFPITLDTSAWYASTATMALLFLTAIALYALSVSLAGRSLLRDDLFEA